MDFFKLLVLCIAISCIVSIGHAECDHPEAPEQVRIYFANGMSNSYRKAKTSQEKLQFELGMQDKDFGIAYNDNENWLTQLLEVYQQRQNESDEFWYWLRNMGQAPQWFKDEYAQKVGRFNEQMVINDPDLQKHIRQYLADLVSGKKVVIVAHSQGNFYANNAYRYIKMNYQKYRNSIGIVSVATPATWVEGGGTYVLDNVYTTNPEDLVINLVRAFYPDTLAANVPAYDNPDSMIDHEFVETYLGGYKSRIIGQILQRIASLETPEKTFECKEPEEVPVEVNTTYATNVSATSALLNGYVVSGKQIAGLCIRQKAASGDPATCWSYRNLIATSGNFDTGEGFYCIADGLSPGTDYKFRVCGREGDRISDGGVKSFKTGGTQCGASASYSGGTEGLSITYGMGSSSGYSLVEFEAYEVPDKLEIWQGDKLLYTTSECSVFGCSSGYVSGYHSKQVYHNPSNGEIWKIRVYGNSITSTKWDVKISCPE